MKHSWISFAGLLAAFAPEIGAQMMATMGPVPLESIGLPPQPPFLTLLGMAGLGKLATDPSISPIGAVSEVFHEELRGTATAAGPAGAVEASVRTKFDRQGRVVEQVENRWNHETDTLYGYQSDRLVSMDTTFPDNKKAAVHWSYWTYDSGGKLKEYRRGGGSTIENHELGFQYDNKGRLLRFENRQGADDAPFSRTEVTYSNDAKRVVVTTVFAGTKIIDRSARTLDDQGRVVRVMLDSEGRATNEQAHNIVFRYDEQGRLVEQTTDASKFSDSGVEHDLPPGTISIAYDDRTHTKTTKYSNPDEGTLEFAVVQDKSGATLAYSSKIASHKEAPQELSAKLECRYDHRGNWIKCRQVVEKDGQKTVKQEFRRTITYR
jgi:YD repeat-containing protein